MSFISKNGSLSQYYVMAIQPTNITPLIDTVRVKLGTLGVNDYSTLENILKSKNISLNPIESNGTLNFELTNIPMEMTENGIRGLIDGASYNSWKPTLHREENRFLVRFQAINTSKDSSSPNKIPMMQSSQPNPFDIINSWYRGGTPLGLSLKLAPEMNKRIIQGKEVAKLDLDPSIPRDKLEYVCQGEVVFGTASNIENLVTIGVGPCMSIVVYDEENKSGLIAHLDSRPKIGLMEKLS